MQDEQQIRQTLYDFLVTPNASWETLDNYLNDKQARNLIRQLLANSLAPEKDECVEGSGHCPPSAQVFGYPAFTEKDECAEGSGHCPPSAQVFGYPAFITRGLRTTRQEVRVQERPLGKSQLFLEEAPKAATAKYLLLDISICPSYWEILVEHKLYRHLCLGTAKEQPQEYQPGYNSLQVPYCPQASYSLVVVIDNQRLSLQYNRSMAKMQLSTPEGQFSWSLSHEPHRHQLKLPPSWVSTFQKCRGSLQAYCLSYGVSIDDTEDLVQKVALEYTVKPPRPPSASTTNPESYYQKILHKRLHCRMIDLWRKHSRARSVSYDMDDESGSSQEIYKELVAPQEMTRDLISCLKEALQSCDPQDIEIFWQHHIIGKSKRQVATDMDLPLSSINTKIKKIREQLQAMIKKSD